MTMKHETMMKFLSGSYCTAYCIIHFIIHSDFTNNIFLRAKSKKKLVCFSECSSDQDTQAVKN